ncbi:MAG: hypothetical protein H6815_09035 [Phycisphaeraceae bacterium]|nr:hypothetical protein [Phycisphaerales bacterium]MCB9860583.1 hypothetical protein [Phycisphaeraceae bacterium]
MSEEHVSPLQDLVSAAEAEMAHQLKIARAAFTHPGDKGFSVEAAVRKFLATYLPRSMSVGHGEVVDNEGHRSNQTDVVIISDDHPLIFPLEQPGLFFIEGVRAAGEVKSVLTAENLASAVAASGNFKRLKAQPGHGTMVRASHSDLSRYGHNAPYFLIALECKMSPNRIAEVLRETVVNDITLSNNMFDAIVVRGVGMWVNMMDGRGNFCYVDSTGNPATGWIMIKNDHLLYDFLSWLTCSMLNPVRSENILPRYLMQSGSLEEIRNKVKKSST